VITERHGRFSGTFDPGGLESRLNSYAAEGWRLSEGLMAANIWKSAKAEIVLVLQRALP
jgi:hypothetical protein